MGFLKSIVDPNASSKNRVRQAWDRLQGLPGGKRAFSRLAGMAAPYTGTIVTGTCDCPLFDSNQRQECAIHVSMRDRAGDEVARATLRTLVGPKKQA